MRPQKSRPVNQVCSTACDPAGIRTQDPILKRDVLYLLSYGINPLKSGAKIGSFFYFQNKFAKIFKHFQVLC